MIRRRVAGVTDETELPLDHLAELLRMHRSPDERRPTAQAQLLQQPIGGLRRARERAWKDLGVRDDHLLLAGERIARELCENVQVLCLQLRDERPRLAADVAGVQAVEQEDELDAVVSDRRLEKLAHRTVPRAPRR